MLMASLSANAQRAHSRHVHHPHPVHVVKVLPRPVVVPCAPAKLSKADRLEMALAYLKSGKCLTVTQYHKMTGLSNEVAEAELDSFAADAACGLPWSSTGGRKCTSSLSVPQEP